MRRAVVSLVTAATVLWHAVIGCCAHHDACVEHAHEHEQVVVVEHAADDHDADHDCSCTHDAHDDHDAAPVQQLPDEAPASHSEPAAPCDDAECSFLAVKLTSSAEWLGEQLLTADVPEVRTIALTEVDVVAARLAPGDDRPPPLRTHLALSILLV
jgi:hypothetical protein